MSKNKSLEKLINSYYNPNSEIFEDEAKILAVKYVLSMPPEEALAYLNTDSVLDGINGKMEFFRDREKFDKYLDFIFFDKEFPENRKEYLYNLKKNSRMLERLIAAKIIDEDKDLGFEFLDENGQDKMMFESVYEIASDYLDSGEFVKEEDAIREAIRQVIRFRTREDSIKILGEKAFVDFILGEEKILNKKFEYFSKEARYLYEINPKDKYEEYIQIQKIIDDKVGMQGYDLIAEQLRREFFPTSGMKISEMIDLDEDDFDDED